MKYDWPDTAALVAYVQEHGLSGAAELLGVARTTLRDHLVAAGVPREDRVQKLQSLNADALKEVHALLSGDGK